jgi:hypothetical protein
MPNFASPFSEPLNGRKLTTEELIRAIRFVIAAEYEAAQMYMQVVEATDNELVKKVLTSVTDEERVHAGEFLKVLHELAPDEAEHYKEGEKEVKKETKSVSESVEIKPIKVSITENPNGVSGSVLVVYDGKTHRANWRQDETLSRVVGDEYLLKAVMTAWEGVNEFSLTERELEQRGGGWWSPRPVVESAETSKDNCPICNEKPVSRCRCGNIIKHTAEDLERGHGLRCPNGHIWSYQTTDNKLLLGVDLNMCCDATPVSESVKNILRMIDEKTITVDDFNRFIMETSPTSINKRVQRQLRPARIGPQVSNPEQKVDNKTDHEPADHNDPTTTSRGRRALRKQIKQNKTHPEQF